MMYLKVSLSDYLSLFNARTTSWFFARKPSMIVVIAGVVSSIAATILALFWPFGSGMCGVPVKLAVFVWLYSLFSFIVQDVAKVITYRLLAYFEVVLPIESYDTEYACAHLEAELHGASRSSDALEHHTTQTDRIIDIEPGIKPIMT